MGVGRINIWVSGVADACSTWNGSGRATVFDCDGVLQWPCGRFRTEGTQWIPVANGEYRNLPFRCGHLEVELPPGCYWIVAGHVSPGSGYIHLNYTTHVGIVQVGCDAVACVKLYNPSVRLCWNWFFTGLRVLAARGDAGVDEGAVRELQQLAEKVLAKAPPLPAEKVLFEVTAELSKLAAKDVDGELG
jgi:hypothetical protein